MGAIMDIFYHRRDTRRDTKRREFKLFSLVRSRVITSGYQLIVCIFKSRLNIEPTVTILSTNSVVLILTRTMKSWILLVTNFFNTYVILLHA